MILDRIRALAYLGYRALVAHPLKRLSWRGTGIERFFAAYQGEGLVPARIEDRETWQAAAACISCGLCQFGVDQAEGGIETPKMVLHAAFRLHSKSDMALAGAGHDAAFHPASMGVEAICPTGVPIARILAQLSHQKGSQPAEVSGRVA